MNATTNSQSAVRRALAVDAAATAGLGILLVAAAGALEPVLGLPAGLLRWAGLVLVPFAAVLGYVASRPRVSERAMWAIIGCNVLWAADSMLLLASGWVQATAPGAAFVAAQGLAVAAFAWLEYAGVRRMGPAVAL